MGTYAYEQFLRFYINTVLPHAVAIYCMHSYGLGSYTCMQLLAIYFLQNQSISTTCMHIFIVHIMFLMHTYVYVIHIVTMLSKVNMTICRAERSHKVCLLQHFV